MHNNNCAKKYILHNFVFYKRFQNFSQNLAVLHKFWKIALSKRIYRKIYSGHTLCTLHFTTGAHVTIRSSLLFEKLFPDKKKMNKHYYKPKNPSFCLESKGNVNILKEG